MTTPSGRKGMGARVRVSGIINLLFDEVNLYKTVNGIISMFLLLPVILLRFTLDHVNHKFLYASNLC